MKIYVNANFRRLSMMVILGGITALMIPGVQMAAADPLTVELTPVSPAIVGSTTTINVRGVGGLTGLQMIVAESGEATQLIAGTVFPAPCTLPLGNNAGGTIWRAENGDGTATIWSTTTSTETAQATFGSGGTPAFTVTGAGSVSAAAPTYDWVRKAGPVQPDNLDILTPAASPYRIAVCGYEGPSNAYFGSYISLFTQSPVAGEILPIITTALLLAGISTNAMWVLPALAVVAGSSFAVLRYQVTRKDI